MRFTFTVLGYVIHQWGLGGVSLLLSIAIAIEKSY